jgi:hypothetical protein
VKRIDPVSDEASQVIDDLLAVDKVARLIGAHAMLQLAAAVSVIREREGLPAMPLERLLFVVVEHVSSTDARALFAGARKELLDLAPARPALRVITGGRLH